MRRIKIIFLTFILLLSVSFAYSQNYREITGKVSDKNGEPLAGVSVLQPASRTGISTGYEGVFKINAKKGDVLKLSFVGFEDYFLTITDKDIYEIVMKEKFDELNQVIVTGYSNVEKRKSTGAVATITSEELKGSPLKNVDNLLQGKMAGVVVQMTSGRPGQAAKVRIRGTNTITGNAEPLWVIDGVPLQKNIPKLNSSKINAEDFDDIFATGIGTINPNDIESITVLKDAAAAAIYGSQAASGVIVVTTKRGREGKTSISYSGSFSVQTRPYRDAGLMNSREKLDWEKELWNEFSAKGFADKTHYPVLGIVGMVMSGHGKFKNFSDARKNEYLDDLGKQSTDWFRVLFRNSISQSHNVSVSGGSDRYTFYVSGAYNRNNGLLLKNSTDSYFLSAKLDVKPVGWIDLALNADLSYLKSVAPSNHVNPFKYAYFANPYESPYNPDGSYKADDTYFSLGEANGNSIVNPLPDNGFNILREINETESNAVSSSSTVKGNINIHILPELTLTGLASFTYGGDLTENIVGKNTYAAWEDRVFDNFPSKRIYGSITQSGGFNTSYLLRAQLNYSKSFFEKHYFNAVTGSEIRSSYSRSIITKRYGYDSVTGNHSTPLYESPSGNSISYDKLVSYGKIMDALNGQGKSEDAFASFYGTMTYTYDGRYVSSVTLRSDGSNNFGSNQQFNLNWSLSGAWNIDKERWMKPISHIISSLVIRAGYGYTGGVNKTVYPVMIMEYLPSFRKTDTDFFRMGEIRKAPNPNLRWEKNRTFNIGLNFGFFDDRISGEVSMYRNKNTDQVTMVKVLSTTGFPQQSYNTSEQINDGYELFINSFILKRKSLKWRVSANMAYNYNELTKYVAPSNTLFNDYAVGYPLGKIFSGKPTGINPETGIYEYELRNDAKIVNATDYLRLENYLFYVGTSIAPWNGGFSTSFSYNNFTVGISGNFSIGAKVLNNIVSPASFSKAGSNKSETVPSYQNDLYAHHLNSDKRVRHRWTPRNPVTDGYPRLIDAFADKITDKNGNYIMSYVPSASVITSGSMLEKLSYLKISSVTMSYSLPSSIVEKLHVKDMSIGLFMNNLFVFTNYTGIDPEAPGAVYPQARTYSVNVSLNF